MADPPPIPDRVAEAFSAFEPAARQRLLALRALVFETAARLEGVGRVEETLKWGEPAYLTPETKSGSTVRLGAKAARPGECFVYFNCQTTLVEQFREWFEGALRFEGNRAIALRVDEPLPVAELAQCLEAALTYHRR